MQKNIIGTLEKYIRGKDQDQAAVLEKIYAKDAKVIFDIQVNTIAFPTEIVGNTNIANTLSRDFNQRHDCVKTYYLIDDSKISCTDNINDQQWLVIMRDKETGEIKIGTGVYDWQFTSTQDGDLSITKHKITIAVMICLPKESTHILKSLQQELTYPWVEKHQVITAVNVHNDLNDLSLYLASH